MSKQLEMSEVERKFIMMSRIAVLLSRKGLSITSCLRDSSLYFAVMMDDCIVDAILSNTTEAELLEWWTILDNEVQ